MSLKLSIIGLGWFGQELATKLTGNCDVLGTTRSMHKVESLNQLGIKSYLLNYPLPAAGQLFDADFIVLNIPPFEGQVEWFKSWPWNKKTHLIFISSTSIYGDGQGIVDEETMPIPNTIGGLILIEEEAWVKTFSKHTIIRFGGLIGKERHPGKFLQGRTNIPHGNWTINLIHLDDTVAFVKKVIEEKVTGTFNLVSDLRQTRREYYTHYCENNKLPPPTFIDSDQVGKFIKNDKVKQIYTFKRAIF